MRLDMMRSVLKKNVFNSIAERGTRQRVNKIIFECVEFQENKFFMAVALKINPIEFIIKNRAIGYWIRINFAGHSRLKCF